MKKNKKEKSKKFTFRRKNKIKNCINSILKEEVKPSNLQEYKKFIDEAIDKKIPLLKCAENFKTPAYVLDEELLERRAKGMLDNFRSKLPNTRIFYAFKSNDLPYMIKKLKNVGINADVASKFELMLALKLGFNEIIYTAPMKSHDELLLAIKNYKKVTINVDNFDELELINEIIHNLESKPKRRVSISFRIQPNDKAHKWYKFGFTLEEFKKAAKMVMKNKQLRWDGIHFHSSWNAEPSAYKKNIKMISTYLAENFTKKELSNLRFFDIGGGLLVEGTGTIFNSTDNGKIINKAINKSVELKKNKRIVKSINDDHYFSKLLKSVITDEIESIDTFSDVISESIKKYLFEALGRDDIQVWMEPGRYLSSIPTYILLKVRSIKRGNIFVDGGINLMGSASFDYEFFPIVNISKPSMDINESIIYGPLCDPDDHWGYRYFGKECKKGDILAVMHQGAYTFSTAWRWQQPTAKYCSFKNDKVKVIKKEESFDDRYGACSFK